MVSKFVREEDILCHLLERYPALNECRESIMNAYFLLEKVYTKGGCLYIAGNGGSASDSGHIAGELMKSFLLQRSVDLQTLTSYERMFGEAGKKLGKSLQGGLAAVPLSALSALLTAITNDIDGDCIFSQTLHAVSKTGDAFLGISTSGNSVNIVNAMMVAAMKNISCIGLTGERECRMDALCDVVIHVPETETYKVQELHQPVYHALCAMLELHFFGQAQT